MTTILTCDLFFSVCLLRQTFNNNSLKNVMCSAFKLAPVEDLVLWEPIGFSLIQETY